MFFCCIVVEKMSRLEGLSDTLANVITIQLCSLVCNQMQNTRLTRISDCIANIRIYLDLVIRVGVRRWLCSSLLAGIAKTK